MVRKQNQGTQIRIRGVVKAMQLARERLSAGVPAAEMDGFRRWVIDMTSQVEAICRQHRLKPEQLPAPTYRAYQYLKTLNLDDLSWQQGNTTPKESTRQVRKQAHIRFLVALCKDFRAEMAEIADGPHTAQPKMIWNQDAQVEDLLKRIRETAAQAEQICREQRAEPGDLPLQSRRAYQWLKYLSQPNILYTHLDSLRLAYELDSQEVKQKDGCRRQKRSEQHLPILFDLYHVPVLYRARRKQGRIHLVANEGFAGAPKHILRALICAAVRGESGPELAELRTYAAGADFRAVIQTLGNEATGSPEVARGQHYDLGQVFERVNEEYFQSRLERPHLTWNKTITHRKLGHYDSTTDTVMVSITLDHPDVPDYVVDYVMYHELLHKHMGIRLVNGRHMAHDKAFRQQERQFRMYAQAQEFLKQIGQKTVDG